MQLRPEYSVSLI